MRRHCETGKLSHNIGFGMPIVRQQAASNYHKHNRKTKLSRYDITGPIPNRARNKERSVQQQKSKNGNAKRGRPRDTKRTAESTSSQKTTAPEIDQAFNPITLLTPSPRGASRLRNPTPAEASPSAMRLYGAPMRKFSGRPSAPFSFGAQKPNVCNSQASKYVKGFRKNIDTQ